MKRVETDDHVVWSLSHSHSRAIVNDIYSDLISKKIMLARQIFSVFWCPLKVIIFSWLVFYNKNLTWENLRKRSWHGPSRCVLCKAEEETNYHLFFKCTVSQQMWYELASYFSFPHLNFISVNAAFAWWGRQEASKCPILPITIWCLWKWGIQKSLKIQIVPSNMFCLLSQHSIFPSEDRSKAAVCLALKFRFCALDRSLPALGGFHLDAMGSPLCTCGFFLSFAISLAHYGNVGANGFHLLILCGAPCFYFVCLSAICLLISVLRCGLFS